MNEVTSATEAAPAKNPSYRMDLTVLSVDRRTDSKGRPYAYARVEHPSKKGVMQSVAMAFGKAYDATIDALVPGTTVKLAARFEEGVLRLIGMPLPPKAAAAA